MQYQLKITTGEKDKIALSKIRRKVFIDEQSVPEQLEWDEDDEACSHVLVTDKHNTPIATGRMKPDGHIGRMAVLKDYRNSGIGSAVLKELLKSAVSRNLNHVYLYAQITAIPFYEKQGFKISSDEFMDAGISHKTMQLTL